MVCSSADSDHDRDERPIAPTGYPGHEHGMRKALKKVLGEEKYDFFFDKASPFLVRTVALC